MIINKFLKKLVLIALFPASLAAQTYTNKTYLQSLPYSYRQYMNYATWHRQLYTSPKDRVGSGFALNGFYRFSTNTHGLGKYFGADGSRNLSVGFNSAVNNIDSQALIHRDVPPAAMGVFPPGASNIVGTIKLSPRQDVWGVAATYHQELDFIGKGLYLRLQVPLESMRNDMHIHLENDMNDSVLNVSLLDYFAGNVTQPNPNLQAALTSAKIGGAHTETEITSIATTLGWAFTEVENYRIGLSMIFKAPLGERQSGEFLFEPVPGSSLHFSLEPVFESAFTIDRSRDFVFECSTFLAYRYVFHAQETRTLGFKQDDKTVIQWSPYVLGGQIGQRGVFPLANVLTRRLHVTPGSQVEGTFTFSLHGKYTTIDLGYSFFAREAEKVSVVSWPEDTYAFADFSYNTTDPFGIGFGPTPPNDAFTMNLPNNTAITKAKLDTDTCTSPAVTTNTVYAAFGCTFDQTGVPIMFGFGGAYEFTDNNGAIEGLTFWGKFGFMF